MKSKDIINAMGQIDSRLIDEALEATSVSKASSQDIDREEGDPESVTVVFAPPKSRAVFKWAGAAAVVGVVTAGVLLLGRYRFYDLLGGLASNTSDDITAAVSENTAVQPAETTEPSAEITDGGLSAAPDNNTELLPNGLPDVPLAEPVPLEEFFDTSNWYGYSEEFPAAPSVIADGRVYFTTCGYGESADKDIGKTQLLCYDPRKDEISAITSEPYPMGETVEYDILCIYGDYAYIYRSAYPNVLHPSNPYEYPYTSIASYTLCRISLENGEIQTLAGVTLEQQPYRNDVALIGDYMYFEVIESVDNTHKRHIYGIKRLNLYSGEISAVVENARCPLLYQDRIAFYREDAFYCCEWDGSNEKRLFDSSVNFSKDRLSSDGKSLVLARSYEKKDGDRYAGSAFTIEVSDGMSGFVQTALFTEDVTASEYFLHAGYAPPIQHTDGCFGFLDVIFLPDTCTFVKITPMDEAHSLAQILMADGVIYCHDYETYTDRDTPEPLNGCFTLIRK